MVILNLIVFIIACVGLALILAGKANGMYITLLGCLFGAIVKIIETGINGFLGIAFVVCGYIIYQILPVKWNFRGRK